VLLFAVIARMAVAVGIGYGVLLDAQVLRDLWLLPVRDCLGLALWVWSYAGDTVEWRGERFRVKQGKLLRIVQGQGRA
jgi:ceramide glucosyltransferase